jgi:hypothetical protein
MKTWLPFCTGFTSGVCPGPCLCQVRFFLTVGRQEVRVHHQMHPHPMSLGPPHQWSCNRTADRKDAGGAHELSKTQNFPIGTHPLPIPSPSLSLTHTQGGAHSPSKATGPPHPTPPNGATIGHSDTETEVSQDSSSLRHQVYQDHQRHLLEGHSQGTICSRRPLPAWPPY